MAVLLSLGAGRPAVDGHTTVLVLGDSISAAQGIQREQGWVHLLRSRLDEMQAGYRVVNASISGDTTDGGLARLPEALATHNPALVVIELGGNDGLRGYPIANIRKNIEKLVQLAGAGGRAVLLVGMQIPPNYGYRYTRAFQALFEEVAEDLEIAVVPSFLQDVGTSPELMQDDGVHPNAAAQPILLDTLWPQISTLLAKVARGQ